MIGLGRMGANMVQRLLASGHECVVYDRDKALRDQLAAKGAIAATSIDDVAGKLTSPRIVWMMVPAAAVAEIIASVAPMLAPGDVLIDGGNSHYRGDIGRAKALAESGVQYVDVGVSGGIFGLELGYCQMIGGDRDTVAKLAPIFAALAPGDNSGNRHSITEPANGYLYCGPSGAGHFVKMVHNGIEYGLMAAYAEGFNLLQHANAGKVERSVDAETAPLPDPQALQYDFDTAAISELWRHGSVIRSWLLDLTASALQGDPSLAGLRGRVSDSGEGRWTLHAAIDASVPMPVLAAALHARFASRDQDDYANRLLSAMRREFGGHHER
ncbi:MAG TPA: decarboxylating 6-phosphogluconate dehydrogenase [Woeseiaceae bacterium]|nr:decarboxylating 6-phosphogluconate dehydrogenase [Woeseiaceae bacterium]